MIFKRRKKRKTETAAELRFNRVMDLVKDLDQGEFKRLKQAMDKAYNAYQVIRGIEGEDDDIQDAEATLSEEENQC